MIKIFSTVGNDRVEIDRAEGNKNNPTGKCLYRICSDLVRFLNHRGIRSDYGNCFDVEVSLSVDLSGPELNMIRVALEDHLSEAKNSVSETTREMSLHGKICGEMARAKSFSDTIKKLIIDKLEEHEAC